MPYKDKEDYNNYLREYMRRKRGVKPTLNPVKPTDGLKAAGLVLDGNTIIGVVPDKRVSTAPGQAYISDFEVDADGNIIPSFP